MRSSRKPLRTTLQLEVLEARTMLNATPVPAPAPGPAPTPPPPGLTSPSHSGGVSLQQTIADGLSCGLAMGTVAADTAVLAGKYFPSPQTETAAALGEAFLVTTQGPAQLNGFISLYNHVNEGQYDLAAADAASLAGKVELALPADVALADEAQSKFLSDIRSYFPPATQQTLLAPSPTPGPTPTPTPGGGGHSSIAYTSAPKPRAGNAMGAPMFVNVGALTLK